jgi:hypothetical protein
MTNIQLAALANRAGFGERTENQIHIEEFAKLKRFAEMVLAQRQWVGMTDAERYELLDKAYNPESYAVLVEAKLKEKNT